MFDHIYSPSDSKLLCNFLILLASKLHIHLVQSDNISIYRNCYIYMKLYINKFYITEMELFHGNVRYTYSDHTSV